MVCACAQLVISRSPPPLPSPLPPNLTTFVTMTNTRKFLFVASLVLICSALPAIADPGTDTAGGSQKPLKFPPPGAMVQSAKLIAASASAVYDFLKSNNDMEDLRPEVVDRYGKAVERLRQISKRMEAIASAIEFLEKTGGFDDSILARNIELMAMEIDLAVEAAHVNELVQLVRERRGLPDDIVPPKDAAGIAEPPLPPPNGYRHRVREPGDDGDEVHAEDDAIAEQPRDNRSEYAGEIPSEPAPPVEDAGEIPSEPAPPAEYCGVGTPDEAVADGGAPAVDEVVTGDSAAAAADPVG